MRSTSARLAASLVLLAPSLARADETPGAHFSLSWVRMPGAAACVGGRELARAVEDRLRRPVFGPMGQADVAVEGHVAPSTPGSWHAVVSITDRNGVLTGTRELESHDPSCADLEAPLALAIALMIDPNASLAPPATPAQEPAPTAPLPVVPAVAPPEPEKKAAVSETTQEKAGHEGWRSFILASGGVAQGLLPRTAGGAMGRVGFLPPGLWPIVLHGAYWAEQDKSVAGTTRSAVFSMAYGGASTCPLTAESANFGFLACAGLEAGVVSTRAQFGNDIRIRRPLIFDAVVRAEANYAFSSHVFAAIGAGMTIPFMHNIFEYGTGDPPAQFEKTSALAAVFDFGLGLRSP